MPLTEESTTNPISTYGADKLGYEQHGLVGAHVPGVPNTGPRFFNVYGPRQDPRSLYSGVISIFADRIGRGDGVTIFAAAYYLNQLPYLTFVRNNASVQN
jgi:UDP-glucose 4-epimerase